jgi:predicted ATP-grasp superfamily ATP-dependent carboligase
LRVEDLIEFSILLDFRDIGCKFQEVNVMTWTVFFFTINNKFKINKSNY